MVGGQKAGAAGEALIVDPVGVPVRSGPIGIRPPYKLTTGNPRPGQVKRSGVSSTKDPALRSQGH
jgi:hypothetical protein